MKVNACQFTCLGQEFMDNKKKHFGFYQNQLLPCLCSLQSCPLHIPQMGMRTELLRNSPHPHISLPWLSKRLPEDLGGLCPPAPGLHTQMDFRDASKGAGEEWSREERPGSCGIIPDCHLQRSSVKVLKKQGATGLKVSQGQRCCHRGVPTMIKSMTGVSRSLGTGSSTCQPSRVCAAQSTGHHTQLHWERIFLKLGKALQEPGPTLLCQSLGTLELGWLGMDRPDTAVPVPVQSPGAVWGHQRGTPSMAPSPSSGQQGRWKTSHHPKAGPGGMG